MNAPHQYLERHGAVVDERLFGDRIVSFLYSRCRERAPRLFAAATSARCSKLLALTQFDLPLASQLLGSKRFLRRCGVDLDECYDAPETLTTPRRIFERRIRYWDTRPMPEGPGLVVSPADSRVVVGSLRENSTLFVKDKFFRGAELLGEREPWVRAFEQGDWAVFRLTPDKYHYNHCPVSGVVEDVYEVDGCYHACNPGAVVEVVSPYSKNRRAVTVIDTDVEGGSGVGRVAMVEVVALMIGDLVPAYSEHHYDQPRALAVGDLVRAGQPKSLFRPGSSTDVLLFERGRIEFAEDLLNNRARRDVHSRFSAAFGESLVETEVAVRSLVARARPEAG